MEPQLAENIGMVARAMANFDLEELRLVKPRGGWPKKGTRSAASGATHILDDAILYDTVSQAVTDLNYVFATTARERDQMKRVMLPDQAMQHTQNLMSEGNRIGILFGRERTGLSNDEVALADAIITFPVSTRFPSLNLAQAVLLISYEWQKSHNLSLPFTGERRSPLASRGTLLSFLDFIENELENRRHYPEGHKPVMARNMRDIFLRRELSEQDVRTLRGICNSLIRQNKKDF